MRCVPEPKDVLDQSRALATDTGLSPCLAQSYTDGAATTSARGKRLSLRMSLTRRTSGNRAFRILADARREALHQLAGDADDHLARAEAGHLLRFLERDLAVVDDRGDVGDRARLHVREALALAADAAHGRRAVVG